MELINNINNNLNIENKQNKYLNNIFTKTINCAIDIGLKTILPDLIENQIIDIKNSILKNGLKEGINKTVNYIIDLSKSTKGIFTGNFENINQVQTAIGDGGIIETFSEILDKAINKTYELGVINTTICSMIKKGKDIILDNLSSNIKKEFNEQGNLLENLEKYINNWEGFYNLKNFEGMTKEYNKIEKIIENIIPLENVIKKAREIETIHNLIKNNGHNFEITDLEKQVINKFSN